MHLLWSRIIQKMKLKSTFVSYHSETWAPASLHILRMGTRKYPLQTRVQLRHPSMYIEIFCIGNGLNQDDDFELLQAII